MPLELPAYRDNLEQVLKFSEGRQLLRIGEVAKFAGVERHYAKRRFPFKDGYISAATLARCLCPPTEESNRRATKFTK